MSYEWCHLVTHGENTVNTLLLGRWKAKLSVVALYSMEFQIIMTVNIIYIYIYTEDC